MRAFSKGEFDYNQCFFGVGGFLSPDANEEKHMMSFYLEVLTHELAKKGIVFGGNNAIHWLEPGIGDGTSTEKFIKAVLNVHSAGVIIHGSDYQPESIEKARQTFDSLNKPNIQIGELVIQDAFSGEPLATQQCDFALLSHFIYHLKNQLDGNQLQIHEVTEKLNSLVKGVMNSIGENGIALAFHEGPKSDMFGKIGLLYGSAMHDATDRIAHAAAANNKSIIRMPLESRLYFPLLSDDILEDFKDINNWKNFSEDSPAASWLKKFLFALHNVPQPVIGKRGGALDLANEVSEYGNKTRLGDAIDFVKKLLQQENGKTYIIIRSEMQAILNNPQLVPDVEAAFFEVESRLPEIKHKTQLALQSAINLKQDKSFVKAVTTLNNGPVFSIPVTKSSPEHNLETVVSPTYEI